MKRGTLKQHRSTLPIPKHSSLLTPAASVKVMSIVLQNFVINKFVQVNLKSCGGQILTHYSPGIVDDTQIHLCVSTCIRQ